MTRDSERLIDVLELLEDAADGAVRPLSRQAIESDPALSLAVAAWGGSYEELEHYWSQLRRADDSLTQLIPAECAPLPEIDGYQIRSELGRGGMGVVFRARQTRLGREVALKLIGSGRLASPRMRQRFLAESHALARLRDPSIVQVYDAGESGGELYLAMELLDGGTLAKRLSGRALPPREAAELIERLARAVAHAHRQGILHRDLKPANVLFDGSGTAKLADFGLAKLLDGESGATATGEMPGTPSYMAPEQITGKDVGERTDVYGLGAVLYEALVGRPPFLGETTAETLLQAQSRDAVPPRRLRKEIPRDLEAVCLKCLEKDPQRRYASAAALGADVRRWLEGEPTLARRLTPLGVLWRRAAARPVTSALIALTSAAIVAVAIGASLLAAHLNRSLQAVEEREADLRARLYAWDTRQGLDAWSVFSRDQNIEMLNRYVPRDDETDLRSFPWHYWNKLCRGADWEITHHDGQVYGLAYSVDGRYLFSGGAEGRLCVWDLNTRRLVDVRWTDHGEVCNLALSPGGEHLLCGRQDGTVELWAFAEGRLAPEPEVFSSGQSTEARGVAASSDGRWLAAAHPHGELAIWSRAEGKRVRFSENDPSHCKAVVFSHDDQTLITCAGGSVYCLDLASGMWREVIVEGDVDSFALSPDGNWLAAAGNEGRVLRVELDTGRWEELFRQGPQVLHEVDFSPDGKYLLTGGDDERLCIWEVATRRLVCQMKAHSGVVWTAAFSPDGETIASCGADQSIRLFRTIGLLGPERVFAAKKAADCLAFSPDSKTLIVGSHEDSSLTMWDVATWRARREGPTGGKPQHQVHALADGRILLLENDGQLALLDNAHERTPLAVHPTARVFAIDSRDGQSIVAIGLHGATPKPPNGGCVIYDASIGRATWQWDFPEVRHYVMHSADGHSVLFVGVSGMVQLVTAAGARTLDFTLPPYDSGSGGAAWTVDSKTLAYVEAKTNVTLVDIESGTQLGQFIDHSEPITSLTCSPDGRILASGDAGGTVHFWDLATLELAGTLEVEGAVHALTFSPNSRLLAGIARSPGGQRAPRTFVWDASDH